MNVVQRCPASKQSPFCAPSCNPFRPRPISRAQKKVAIKVEALWAPSTDDRQEGRHTSHLLRRREPRTPPTEETPTPHISTNTTPAPPSYSQQGSVSGRNTSHASFGIRPSWCPRDDGVGPILRYAAAWGRLEKEPCVLMATPAYHAARLDGLGR